MPGQRKHPYALLKARFLAVAVWAYSGVLPGAAVGERPLQGSVNPRVIHLPTIDANDIRFTRFSTAQGLSQTRVSQIVEDDQGFMWFGTQYGLNRYDGFNFRTFVNDPNNPNSLSGTLVSALFKDRHGALWIGCSDFLNKFDPETERFNRYPIPLVGHISEDRGGRLWLSTGQGLFALDPSSGHIEHYTRDTKNPLSLSSDDVKSSMEDKEGAFWVITSEGLDEFDRKTATVTLHVSLKLTGREAGLHEDRSGVLWVSYVTGNGLAIFDRKTRTLTRYSLSGREQPDTALTGISAILEEGDGTLWFATMSRGLLKLDQRRRQFLRYSNDPSDPDTLPRDSILSLCQDGTGGIWAALVDSGVSHFEPRPPLFEKFPHNLGNPSGNSEPSVSAIYEDREGTLWIGTRDALNRIDRKTNDHRMYRFSKRGLASPDVISITEDPSGALWIGTFNGGLVRFDRSSGRFKAYRHDPQDPHSLSNDVVTRMLVDHEGSLWIATWNGLNRFDLRTAQFSRYYSDPLKKDILYIDLIQGPDGALWLGTHSSGFQRFDRKGNFMSYQREAGVPGSLSDSRVNSVHFDRSGAMWLGTQNGLDKFDSKTSKLRVYTKQDGLAGNVVGCILEDDGGNLWMSTNDGISQFNIASKSFRNYSIDDGLPGRDLTGWGACFKSPDGEMFFGGFSGGTAFYPGKISHPSYSPSIVLTDFRLFGRPVAIGPHSILTKSISYTSALTLSHNQNVFSLEFSSPNHSATTRYRYKLDNIDRQWNETSSEQRTVTYGALPAGEYVFRAQAANNQGSWSPAVAALKIKILSSWWETSSFKIGSFGLIVFLGWLAYQYRIRQIAGHFHIRMEGQVAERMRLARDLHDTLLQSFQGVLLKFHAVTLALPDRPAEARRTLESAIEQARAAVAEGRDAVQGLRSSVLVTNDLARAITTFGEGLNSDQNEQRAPDFHVHVEGTSRDLSPLVRDEVYRIAGEALRNAFRHACAQRIEVDIHYDARQLRMRVRDDGKGINPLVLGAAGRGGHHGLPGMRERADLVGGKLAVWSELNSGTEVELIISSGIAYAKSHAIGAGGQGNLI